VAVCHLSAATAATTCSTDFMVGVLCGSTAASKGCTRDLGCVARTAATDCAGHGGDYQHYLRVDPPFAESTGKAGQLTALKIGACVCVCACVAEVVAIYVAKPKMGDLMGGC
jgi:hypothetical protein